MHNEEVRLIIATSYAEMVRDCVRSKNLLEDEIEVLRSQLLPKGISDDEKVTCSPSADAIPNGVAKLQELIRDFAVQQSQYVDLYRQMHDALMHIDVKAREALTYHYLHLESWSLIAYRLGYSIQHLMRLRRSGLIQLYDHIPEEYRRILPKAI